MKKLTFENFATQLKTAFRVYRTESDVVTLELIRAERRQPKAGDHPRALDTHNDRFSLLFAGARDAWLGQNTYQFEHPAIGRFDLFIVPVITNNPEQLQYEAVFNRPFPGGKS